jgi:GR25 family glycosyltransferase involved in LPS biosynthesis
MLFENINVMYINLASRSDRNEHVQEQLKKIGVNSPERFNAVKLEDGALGCSMSHLKCLELAKKNNYEYVFICEDDIEFLNPAQFLTQLQSFLNSNITWYIFLNHQIKIVIY